MVMATLSEQIKADIAKREKAKQESTGIFDALRKSGLLFNEAIINPNKYNAPAANAFKDSALGLMGGIPGADLPVGLTAGADYWNRGEKLAAGVSVLGGVLPFVPATAASLFAMNRVANKIGTPLPVGPARSQAGMFIGPKAATWDAIKAQQANELLAKGIDPREVWKQTGTMRGADKALRQEIPDNLAKWNPTPEFLTGNGLTLQHQIMPHEQLGAAYPGLGDVAVRRQATPGGSYSPTTINGRLNQEDIFIGAPAVRKVGDGFAVSTEQGKSINIHEIQHAIQQREGWARGGSPKVGDSGFAMELAQKVNAKYAPEIERLGKLKDWDAVAKVDDIRRMEVDAIFSADKAGGDVGGMLEYKRLAGEAEARLTQSRMNMTMPERAASYPPDMFDVPMNQQIVRMGDNGPAMATVFDDIRPPKEDVYRIASSYSNATKVMGNSTMPLAKLRGGVGSEVGDIARVDKLAKQMTGEGAYLERLVVDDVGNVIEGQHRLEALRKIGIKDVPVVVIKDFERGFPSQDIKNAMATAQQMPSDNANQLASHLAEIFADEKGNLAEIAKYEAPRGFEAAWGAALKKLKMSYADEAAQADKAMQVSPPYLNNPDYQRMDLPEATYAGLGDTWAGYPTPEAYQAKLAADDAQALRIRDSYRNGDSLTARYGIQMDQNTPEGARRESARIAEKYGILSDRQRDALGVRQGDVPYSNSRAIGLNSKKK